MKRFLVVLMFLVFSVSVVYGGWFPINAWGIKYNDAACTTWVAEVSDSFFGNSTKIAWSGTPTIEALLNKGAQCGVDFMIQSLTTQSYVNLSYMARSQFSKYESEEHDDSSITTWPPAAGYFDEGSCIGDTITDSLASNNKAWKVLVNTHQPGYIQRGLVQHRGHRQRYLCRPYFDDSLRYEARFYLRIPDTTDQQENKPVCKISVWRKNTVYSLLDSLTLYRSSFTDTTAYKAFSLWFTKDKSMATHGDMDLNYMDYRIYWYDNYNLYTDKVEVRDTVYYNLEENNYNQAISDIIDKWNGYDALAYYYLWDEPHLNQLDAFYLVDDKMGIYAKPAITCVSHQYGKYEFYSKFIKDCYGNDSTALLTDKYPLRPQDTTPASIQGRFDYLCDWMDNVRAIADTTGTDSIRNVWYICQAHNWIRENGDTVLRNPTPEEMWAIVGLGLAHGAKGVLYFTYASRYEYFGTDSMYMKICGLVDYKDGHWVKNNKWDATRDVNAVLQKVDTFLLDFDFKCAFYGGNLSQDYYNFIKYTSLDTTEFGLFEDSDNLKYFLIVNRTDNYVSNYPPQDSTLVTLGLDGLIYNRTYYIRDCYTGEPYRYDSIGGAQETLYFSFYLKDCHFKLFQIVPFTADVKINNDSTYTDYPFVKVSFDTSTSLSLSDNDAIFMTVWDDEGDTIKDVDYDSTLIWQFDSPGYRTISASCKIVSDNYIQADSGYLTPTYCDTIYLDTIPPTSNSLEVEDVDTLEGFVNKDSVDLSLSSTKVSGIPVRKMRFSNYGFDNLIQNPDFDTTTYWVCVDSASIDSGYGEIDGSSGGKIYQNLGALVVGENYCLYVYVVTDNFTSVDGKIRILNRYFSSQSGEYDSTACAIDIAGGDNALTGYDWMTDTFAYQPSCDTADSFLGCRVEVYQGIGGTGRVIVDNFLLEREYSESCWHDYDTTYSDWALTSGNGRKIISGEFRDAAGNITIPVTDTVILDATVPVGALTSPKNNQVISGTINIRGWAYDAADPDSYFYYYKLEYQSNSNPNWNDCDSAYYYDPKYPDPNQFVEDSSVVLGEWNTSSLSQGYYNLRLTVVDSAVNSYDTTVTVRVIHIGGPEDSGEFSAGKEPKGISQSSHLYVTDIMDGDLRRYNLKGDSIGYISLIKDSVGISKPCAAATDSGGIWIADKHRHKVSYYDYTGNPLFEFGGFGDEEGKFNHPSGIARFNDKVYVTDKLNHRVQVFSNDSSFLFSFGTKGDSAGQFNEPSGITADRHGRIYVTDRINNRIEVFDTSGEYIEYYGEEIELQHPCGILVDSFGYIFVVDEVNGKVWELDPFGDPICQFGEKGEGFGKLLFPQDVAISGDGEKIYVTDRVRKKVVIYDVYDKYGGGGMSAGDVETPIYNCLKACYPVPFSKGVNISYSIAQKGFVSLKVYDVTGRFVKKLVYGVQDRGWYTIQWDSNKQNRKSIASGVYFIRLEIDNFISTRKVLLLK